MYVGIVSHPVPAPVTRLHQTLTRPARLLDFHLNLLLHLSVTYSFPFTLSSDPLQTLPVSRHLLHLSPDICSTPLHSAPSFHLPCCLTYLIRVYPLVSVSLYQTLTPVFTHWTPTGPPIQTQSFSIKVHLTLC